MSNENQQLKLDVKLEVNELIIRHGKAPEPLPTVVPSHLHINGDFRAVGQFLRKRTQGATNNLLQLANPEDAIIYTNKKDLTIALYTNPNDPNATVVRGKADQSEELKLFGVNTQKVFRRDELLKLVRMNKILFTDPQEHSDLLTALKSFKAATTGNTNLESDLRGNKNVAYQKEVKSNMPEGFKLTIPIIKGEPRETFQCEICLEESDGAALFWFESPELSELLAKRIEEMFDRELMHCKGFVVINI
jgi:hypothetical protein